jgi:acetyl esterase/lipase
MYTNFWYILNMEKNFKKIIYGILGIIIIFTLIFSSMQLYKSTATDIKLSNVTPGQNLTDVPYAHSSSSEKMDIYIPNSTGPYPVIIWIHGGGYNSGDKKNNDSNSPIQGLSRGYVVVSINYRLSNEAKFPAQIYDVKSAIRFLRANSKELNIKPDKIALWGRSAGGGLASLAGTSGDVKELQDDSLGYGNISNRVQAVVDLKGPINFSTMLQQLQQQNNSKNKTYDYEQSKLMLKQLMGEDISLIPSQVARANPETYITPDDPPFFIEHGTADTMVPYLQSQEFAIKLRNVIDDDKVTLELFPGLGHNDPYFTQKQNVDKILDFLDKHLK